MKPLPRAALPYVVAVLAWLALAAPLLVAQDASVLQGAPVLTQPVLTPEQMEDFLLNAKILKTRDINKGITGTQRATLSDGVVTHDAQIQTVDIAQVCLYPQEVHRTQFQGTYRYNIAGYRLARLLGLTTFRCRSTARRAQRRPSHGGLMM